MIVTPTIISLVDNTQEIIVLFDIEEEENEGEKSEKDIDIKIQSSEIINPLLLNLAVNQKNINFTLKVYTSEFFKTSTPPPEFNS